MSKKEILCVVAFCIQILNVEILNLSDFTTTINIILTQSSEV